MTDPISGQSINNLARRVGRSPRYIADRLRARSVPYALALRLSAATGKPLQAYLNIETEESKRANFVRREGGRGC